MTRPTAYYIAVTTTHDHDTVYQEVREVASRLAAVLSQAGVPFDVDMLVADGKDLGFDAADTAEGWCSDGGVGRTWAGEPPRRKDVRLDHLDQAILSQQRWMDRCGHDLPGYVANYGSKDDPEHAGDGGEAIFAADLRHLQDLMSQRERLMRGKINA